MSDAARWDTYFHTLTDAAGSNSRCLSRKIGAVIVGGGRYVVSTGYNGPPAGFPNPGGLQFIELVMGVAERGGLRKQSAVQGLSMGDITLGNCPRQQLGFASGEVTWLCPCAHAERNAVANAAKIGHATDGCVMYLSCPTPCRECAKCIVNAGIKEVVVVRLEDYAEEGFLGREILEQSGVALREYG